MAEKFRFKLFLLSSMKGFILVYCVCVLGVLFECWSFWMYSVWRFYKSKKITNNIILIHNKAKILKTFSLLSLYLGYKCYYIHFNFGSIGLNIIIEVFIYWFSSLAFMSHLKKVMIHCTALAVRNSKRR